MGTSSTTIVQSALHHNLSFSPSPLPWYRLHSLSSITVHSLQYPRPLHDPDLLAFGLPALHTSRILLEPYSFNINSTNDTQALTNFSTFYSPTINTKQNTKTQWTQSPASWPVAVASSRPETTTPLCQEPCSTS